MVSKIKRGSRRCFAVALSVLMLLSAWVFVAPESLPKAQAGSPSYKWRVYVYSKNDTGGWNSEQMIVRGKSNNGTGSQSDLLTVNNWKIDFNGERTNTFGKGDQTTSQFPTQLYYYYSFGGGWTKRKIDADIYLQLYYNGDWHTIAGGNVYSNNSGTNKGSKTWDVPADKYPKEQLNAISGGTSSVSVPTDGTTTNKTDAFTLPNTGTTYSAGSSVTVYDQYGSQWYQDASYKVDSHTGVSLTSDKKVAVTHTANAKENYDVYVRQYLGGTEKSSSKVTVKTFDYKVQWFDENGTTSLSTNTVDYGDSATPPSPTKDPDATNHYAFKSWVAMDSDTSYSTIKTGAQTRRFKASYTATAHNVQSDHSQNADEHWKECTVCHYITWGPNPHTPKSTFETNSSQHWKLCSTCGREITGSRGAHTASGWKHDDDGDWKECTTCKYYTTAKTAHTWKYDEAVFNWSDYECETATLTCSKCGRTKTVNTTVSVVNTPSTCEVGGSNVYTASFTDGGTTKTATKTEQLDPLGHNYTGAYHALADNKHNRACVNSCNCGTFGLNGEKNASEACTPADNFAVADYLKDENEHWVKCQYCSNLTLNKTGHEWDYANAVFNWDGYACPNATVTCPICEKTKTITTTVTNEITVPTACLTDGTKVYTAKFTVGGTDYTGTKEEVLGKLGHDWGTVTYTWSAENDYVTARRECARCHAVETEQKGTTNVVTVIPTCTTEGERVFTSAEFENEAFEVQTKPVTLAEDLDNHDFTVQNDGAAYLKSAATCEDNEVYYLKCSRCEKCTNDNKVNSDGTYGGATWTKENTALGHEFTGEAVNAAADKHFYKCVRFDDCESYGVKKDGVWTKNATESCSGGEATCTDKAVCDKCRTVYGSRDPDNHKFTSESTAATYLKTAATCEDDAVYYYKCERCTKSTNDDKVNGEGTYGGAYWTKTGTARGHKYTGDYNALVVDGELKHNRACLNGCGTFGLVVDGVQKKNASEACTAGDMQYDETGHWVQCVYCSNYTTPKAPHDSVSETPYTTDNNQHWKTCSVCGWFIEAAGDHSLEWVVDREATCTEDGLRHRECPVCHLKKQEGTVIPKLGHDWSDVTYTWNEDNTQVTATRTCKRDASHVETETVAVSKSTKNPTCVATGSITYTSKSFTNSAFTVQAKTETLEINPSNHNNKIGPVALKKATCTVDGVKAHYYCSACKKNFSDADGTEVVSEEDLKITARGHDWDEGTVTKEATCAATGVKTYKCQNTTATEFYAACHESYTEEIEINPANHDGHLVYVEIVKASCFAPGVKAHWYCDACNTKFSDEQGTQATTDEALAIAQRAHVWDEGTVTKEATCAETGLKVYTCTCAADDEHVACTETKEETLEKDANNHVGVIDPENMSELRNYVRESCSAPGYSGDRYCLGCGELLEQGHEIETQPHTYTAEDINVENAFVSAATCVSPAIYVKSCKYCGKLDDDRTNTFTYGEINPANHAQELTFTEYKAATCLADGNEAYYTCPACTFNFSDAAGLDKMDNVVIAQLAHSYTGEAADQGDGTHKCLCVNGCNEYGPAVEHTWSEPTTVEPTCTKDGSADYTCTAPGCAAAKHDVLQKLGHDWQKPTYKWADDCSYCIGTKICANDLKGDGTADHTITEKVENIVRTSPEQPTCQKGGRYVYTATFTNSAFTEQYTSEVIPMGTHVLVKIDAVAPTCSEDGSIQYWICSACRHYFSDAEGVNEITLASTFVPRVGHDYSGAVKDNKDGTHSYACIYECGSYGKKTAHAFNREIASDQYLDVASDCVTPATYFYSCECGAKGTSTFEGTPLGHNFVDHEGKDPTCTEPGYTAHKACTRCDATEGKSEILALGHGKYLFDHERSGRVYDGSFEWATYSCSRGCGDSYTLFTIHAKDGNGKPIVGANVTIDDGNGTTATGITGNDGSFTSDVHFHDGEYKVSMSYTSGNSVMTTSGDVRVAGGKGSGGTGALVPTNSGDSSGSGSGSGSGSTTPTDPSGGNSGGNSGGSGDSSGSSGACRYCGETHSGPFGWLIQLIHNILAAFRGK